MTRIRPPGTRFSGPWSRHLQRGALGLALSAGGAAVIWFSNGFRTLEALGGAALTGLAIRSHTTTLAASHTFFWQGGKAPIQGLTVTPDCSSAFVAGPILVVAGGIMLLGRLRTRRVLIAGVLAATVAVATNLLRLGMIGWATFHWQSAGFDWTHVVIGSLMTVVGVFVAVLLFAWVAFGSRIRDRSVLMYVGFGLGATGAVGGMLAYTGFGALTMALAGMLLLLGGLVLARSASLRRASRGR